MLTPGVGAAPVENARYYSVWNAFPVEHLGSARHAKDFFDGQGRIYVGRMDMIAAPAHVSRVV